MQIDKFPALVRYAGNGPNIIRIPTIYPRSNWHFYGPDGGKEVIIRKDDLILVLSEVEKRNYRGDIRYRFIPFWPYIQGEIPKRAITWKSKSILYYVFPTKDSMYFKPLEDV